MTQTNGNLAVVPDIATQLIDTVHTLTCRQALKFYYEFLNSDLASDMVLRELCKYDRYFLGLHILNRGDLRHEWLYERCREVEADPDNYLDLWAREHYKSTIITFMGSIQEILRNREITIGIFSHNRDMAKDFLEQIKSELESNLRLIHLFPDIFYENPRRQSPAWGLESGLQVRRQTNPKEKTVEAWGVVDAQPTGRHFNLMIYDDLVHERFVSTAEMINKTTRMWELSRNLSAAHPQTGKRRYWHAGTRYHYADTYKVMINRKVVETRVYPATDTGTKDGQPVFMTKDDWRLKVQETSQHTLACQQLLNPRAGADQSFNEEWLRPYDVRPETLNVQILVDPASSKKKESCNSAFVVLGMDAHMNRYLLDGACHKMGLRERWLMLKSLWVKWTNTQGVQAVDVGYEKYGMQCDIEHFEEMSRIQSVSIPITPVSWVHDQSGSSQRKDDRILRLVPDFHNWRVYLPYGKWFHRIQKSVAETKGDWKLAESHELSLQRWATHGRQLTGRQMTAVQMSRSYLVAHEILRKNHEGELYNLVDYFIDNEYLLFPATTLKDMLDGMSRTYDMDFQPPRIYSQADINPPYVGEA